MKPDFIQLNEFGQEVPDHTPIVVRIKGQIVTDFDRIREYIKRELREHKTGEVETFEEANDFDVEDDLFPVSAHEYEADTEAADREVLNAVHQERARQGQANQSSEVRPSDAVTSPPVPPTEGSLPPAPSTQSGG